MGVALKDKGKIKEALETYNKAILINPNYALAYNNIGNILKDEGKLNEAIEASIASFSLPSSFRILPMLLYARA